MRPLPMVLLPLAPSRAGCASGPNRPVSSAEAVAGSTGVQRLDADLHSFHFEPNRVVVRR